MISRCRILAAFAVVFIGGSAGIPAFSTEETIQETSPPNVTLRKLTVNAKAAPMPRLRYQLLPNYSQKVAGNAALAYHRAMLLWREHVTAQQRTLATPEARAKFYNADEARYFELSAKPRGEVPVAEIRKFVEERDSAGTRREIRIGTSCGSCEWDARPRIDADYIASLMPEIQGQRELTRALKHRIRLATLEGKPEEAIESLRDGVTLARHTAEGSTLLPMLVGIALMQIQLGEIEYLIQQPEAPNLYWALTDLPTPFVNPQGVIEGELRGMSSLIGSLRDADKGPMSEAKAQDVLVKLADMLNRLGPNGIAPTLDGGKMSSLQEFGMKIGASVMIGLQQEQSRRTLKEVGKTDKEIEAMAPTQRYLVAEWYVCQDIHDTLLTAFRLPISQAAKEFDKQEKALKKMVAESQSVNPLRTLLLMMVPAMQKAQQANVRLERTLAALRTIEAIRMYAAKEGRLPAKLADIEIVSVPNDPLFDRPIEYRLEEGKAILLLPNPPGERATIVNNFRYEVTLK